VIGGRFQDIHFSFAIFHLSVSIWLPLVKAKIEIQKWKLINGK